MLTMKESSGNSSIDAGTTSIEVGLALATPGRLKTNVVMTNNSSIHTKVFLIFLILTSLVSWDLWIEGWGLFVEHSSDYAGSAMTIRVRSLTAAVPPLTFHCILIVYVSGATFGL